MRLAIGKFYYKIKNFKLDHHRIKMRDYCKKNMKGYN